MIHNKIANSILILCGTLMLGLCACSGEEAVFIDAESADVISQESANAAQVSEAEPESQTDTVLQETQNAAGQSVEQAQRAVVHVCGAVVNPGVYELDSGSRVMDAVNLAGGFKEDASEAYVNLAGIISDGDQIVIPTIEEASTMEKSEPQEEKSSGKVNINTADKALLCTLPGIGETRAESIIAYREEHGNFSSIEDIMQVSGIKDSSFQKIKDYIIVN